MYPLTGLFIPADDTAPTEMRTLNVWKDIQRAVDGTFDCVTASMVAPDDFKVITLDVWVNDEGLIWNLPFNRRASYLTQRELVGDAIVLGPVTDDGESTDVPGWLEQVIDSWMDRWNLEAEA